MWACLTNQIGFRLGSLGPWIVDHCLDSHLVCKGPLGCVAWACSAQASTYLLADCQVGGPLWSSRAQSSWWRWNQFWLEPSILAAYHCMYFMRASDIKLPTIAEDLLWSDLQLQDCGGDALILWDELVSHFIFTVMPSMESGNDLWISSTDCW